MGEEPAPHDEVAGAVELEQEQLTRRECPEPGTPSRLPEVDLVDFGQPGQQLEPVPVRDADECPHGGGIVSQAGTGAYPRLV